MVQKSGTLSPNETLIIHKSCVSAERSELGKHPCILSDASSGAIPSLAYEHLGLLVKTIQKSHCVPIL